MDITSRKYTTAPYRYLTPIVDVKVRDAFIRGVDVQPRLQHKNFFSDDQLTRRLQDTKQELATANSQEQRHYLEYRLKQINFLRYVYQLKQVSTAQEARGLLSQVRNLTEELYNTPDTMAAASILESVHKAALHGNTAKRTLWSYIQQHTNFNGANNAVARPSTEVFTRYREYFKQYAPWLFAPKTQLPPDAAIFIDMALERIGAKDAGWQVAIDPTGAHAHVAYGPRLVWLGAHYVPYSWKGMRRLVVHEVYGHVNRFVKSGRHFTDMGEAEGMAIVLEQLLHPVYSMRRSYRYLAVATGWGSFGKPMDFRQTYEIIWRAMMIVSGYTEEVAKRKAFNECARAFRLGRPDIPGAVFTKDIVYFSGNRRVWQFLQENTLTYDQFVDILEGRALAVGD